MTDRLEAIRQRRAYAPNMLLEEDADWLISEIERLRGSTDSDYLARIVELEDEVARLERYRSIGQIPRLDLLLAERDQARDENEQLRGLLGRLEWAGVLHWSLDQAACPVCGNTQQEGHRAVGPHWRRGCELAAALGPTDDPPEGERP